MLACCGGEHPSPRLVAGRRGDALGTARRRVLDEPVRVGGSGRDGVAAPHHGRADLPRDEATAAARRRAARRARLGDLSH